MFIQIQYHMCNICDISYSFLVIETSNYDMKLGCSNRILFYSKFDLVLSLGVSAISGRDTIRSYFHYLIDFQCLNVYSIYTLLCIIMSAFV